MVLDRWTIAALKHHCTALHCTALCNRQSFAAAAAAAQEPPAYSSSSFLLLVILALFTSSLQSITDTSSQTHNSLSLSLFFFFRYREEEISTDWFACIFLFFSFFLPSFISSPLINHVVESVFVVSL